MKLSSVVNIRLWMYEMEFFHPCTFQSISAPFSLPEICLYASAPFSLLKQAILSLLYEILPSTCLVYYLTLVLILNQVFYFNIYLNILTSNFLYFLFKILSFHPFTIIIPGLDVWIVIVFLLGSFLAFTNTNFDNLTFKYFLILSSLEQFITKLFPPTVSSSSDVT